MSECVTHCGNACWSSWKLTNCNIAFFSRNKGQILVARQSFTGFIVIAVLSHTELSINCDLKSRFHSFPIESVSFNRTFSLFLSGAAAVFGDVAVKLCVSLDVCSLFLQNFCICLWFYCSVQVLWPSAACEVTN